MRGEMGHGVKWDTLCIFFLNRDRENTKILNEMRSSAFERSELYLKEYMLLISIIPYNVA